MKLHGSSGPSDPINGLRHNRWGGPLGIIFYYFFFFAGHLLLIKKPWSSRFQEFYSEDFIYDS